MAQRRVDEDELEQAITMLEWAKTALEGTMTPAGAEGYTAFLGGLEILRRL